MPHFIGKPLTGSERGWQMVPLNGEREVTLKDGSGLTVIDAAASRKYIELSQVTAGGNKPANRTFRIRGLKEGKTLLWARRGSKNVATMVVEVKPERTVTVAFNYVRDTAGHRTTRTANTVAELVRKLNDIYQPQANLTFRMLEAREVEIPKDLGDKVIRDRKNAKTDGFSSLVAERVKAAQVNVFFVWECQRAGRTHDTDGVAEIATSRNEKTNCMVEDALGMKFENIVAHEIGHNLGLVDDYNNPKLLMHGVSNDVQGTLLERKQIEKIWAS